MIVAFTGPMLTGKTLAAHYLKRKCDGTVLSFATPLKEMAKRITPDGEIEKLRDRELLQFLGTNYYRKLDSEYWVNKWSEEVIKICRYYSSMNDCYIFSDDCRFPNEAAKAYSLGGYIVKIISSEEDRLARSKALYGGVEQGIASHASEADFDLTPYKDRCFYIYNERDLNYFYSQLDLVMNLIKENDTTTIHSR